MSGSTAPISGAADQAPTEAKTNLPWWKKVLRTFIFAFLGAFVSALLPILDNLANGDDVDYSVWTALLVGAIVGGISAGLRAVIALLPIFSDDNDIGMKR